MDTKITDSEYLKLTDLAYLAFSNSRDKNKTIEQIFKDREDILKDADASGAVDDKNSNGDNENTLWAESQKEYWEAKKTYFGDEFLNSWKVIAVGDNNTASGFFGVAFKNVNTGEVVFSFRGTEGSTPKEKPKDMILADLQIVMGVIPQQFDEALTFYNGIINNSVYQIDKTKVSVAGHSLGGGIAQYVATMGTTAPTTMRTFNGVGIGSQTLVSANDFMGYEGGLSNFISEVTPYIGDIGIQLWNELSPIKRNLLEAAGITVENNAFKGLSNYFIPIVGITGIAARFNEEEIKEFIEFSKILGDISEIAKEEKKIADKIIHQLVFDGLLKECGDNPNFYETVSNTGFNISTYFENLYLNDVLKDGKELLIRAEEKTNTLLNSAAFTSFLRKLPATERKAITTLLSNNMGYDNNFLTKNGILPGEDYYKNKYYQILGTKLEKKLKFSKNFNQRTDNNEYINYVHSKDMTGTVFNHLGLTYCVDKNLTEEENPGSKTYIEVAKEKDSFLKNLLASELSISEEDVKNVTKYHLYDVLTAFIDESTGEESEYINDQYMKAVISRLLNDKMLKEDVINNFYNSINTNTPNGDGTILSSSLKQILSDENNKEYLEKRQFKLINETIKSLDEHMYNFKDLLSSNYLKIYNTLTKKIEEKENKNLNSETSYFDTFFETQESSLQNKLGLKTMIKKEFKYEKGKGNIHIGLVTNGNVTSSEQVALSQEVVKQYESKNNIIFGNELGNTIRINDDNSTDIGYIDNRVFAGGGKDFVSGGKGEDIIYGGAGDDWLNGGVTAGNDKDGFADRIIGGEGDDHLFGGSGYDEYVFDLNEDSGNDVIIDTDGFN